MVWFGKSCPTLANLWSVACQALPSMGFPRQEYWNGLPFPSPGDIPNPGIEPESPALQVDSLLPIHYRSLDGGAENTKWFSFIAELPGGRGSLSSLYCMPKTPERMCCVRCFQTSFLTLSGSWTSIRMKQKVPTLPSHSWGSVGQLS